MKKKILILGGGGYIGRNLVCRLSKGNYVSTIMRRKLRPMNICDLNIFYGNYYTTEFNEMMRDMDVIIHAGSHYHPRDRLSPSDTAAILNDEIELVGRLERLAIEGKLKLIVFLSSGGEVYGGQSSDAHKEEDSVAPLTEYGTLKLAVEKTYFSSLSQLLKVVILRLSNPYGMPYAISPQKNFINNAIGLALTKGKIELWGDGKYTRDFIYMEDVLSAIESVLEKKRQQSDIFNLALGRSYSVFDVAQTIVKQLPHTKIEILKKDFLPPVFHNRIDISKFLASYSWVPSWELENGIQKSIADIKTVIENGQ
jgi:UDP-glucose 4-epimerase